MRLTHGDVQDYTELYALAEKAGWLVDEVKVLEGNIYEVPLGRERIKGTLGTWRGNLAQFRWFCEMLDYKG